MPIFVKKAAAGSQEVKDLVEEVKARKMLGEGQVNGDDLEI
jgi:hypothetical protein